MKKSYTIYFLSNSQEGVKKISISQSVFFTVIGVGVFLALVFSAVAIDYVSLLLEHNENRWLQVENKRLREQFTVVEARLSGLEKGVERVRTYWQKLKTITDVENPNRGFEQSFSLGAKSPTTNLDESNVDRNLASITQEESSGAIFNQKPEADLSLGELSVQDSRDYSTLVVRINNAVAESELRQQGLIDLWQRLSERESLVSSIPSTKPAMGWITSNFGYRSSPFTGGRVMHAGLDIAGPTGTPITAPADGVVSFAGYDAGYGKMVSIDHGYGISTRFGHASQIYVKVGQKIKRGDPLAAIGSTGRSTGPHLHYEVRVNGQPVNPHKYILSE